VAPGTVGLTRFWTNPSVRALAGDRDPVEVVTERARELVFQAIEGGWHGPPYDPFQLAELRQIPLVPREDLYDARIISREGRTQIEFNPTRPRGRVRFSVAHELAHTFFPDYQKAIRYRSRPEPAPDDEWQLELLCNVAASELLMPIGSFTHLEDEPLMIERLMELRKKFDVSTEALLLRIVKLTERPSAVIAAARIDASRTDSPFRLDYVAASRSWAPPLERGRRFAADSVLGECTAVGWSAKGAVTVGDAELHVECVGIPPYPGEKLPRVVGLVLPAIASPPEHGITELLGDARSPRGDGPHLIVHLVNDKALSWAGAFARGLKEKWPEAQSQFKEWAERENLALGKVHVAEVEPDTAVATMIAQRGYGASARPRIRYAALRQALGQVAVLARERGASVHMPRIGAGQAGGDWSIIREMIDQELVQRGVDVTVYALPGTSLPEPAQTRLALAQ
jgi:O-acetyl-ADP-ribose deacetylase (regulator of RNase III)